jgi:uncharacterized membrane protein
MKFGHVESTLLGATPRRWRDAVNELASGTPDIVIVVGVGVVLVICSACAYFVRVATERERKKTEPPLPHPPEDDHWQ